MKTMNKNKQLIVNMAASLLSCLVSLGISFIISPLIIADSGFGASGFIQLAANFTSFAAIVAMALNSMAGRFITIRIHQGDPVGASEYFNSVMYANLGIVALLFIPCSLVVVFLERLVHVSPELVVDAKILFALTFLNFFITVISTIFTTSTFAANRLDLTALRTIESKLLNAGILVACFNLLPVKVYYTEIANLVALLYMFVAYVHYTKKLLPQIVISRKYYKWKKVLEILSAGVWNTVMRAGQAITNGLDTLLANLWISETSMGYVGISKMVATAINTLYETISAVFTPSLTISYAKGNKEELLEDLSSAMKLTGFFANIPLCFVIGFGIPFYTLWLQRAKDITDAGTITLIYLLTVLTMAGTIVGGAISPLFNVYTVVNRLKWNSLVTLFMGILSVGTVFLFFRNSPYCIYAIVGTSTVIGIIKNATFTPMYAAHCLGISKGSFYPTLIRYTLVSVVMASLFSLLNIFINTDSWLILVLDIFLCGVIGSVLNFFFLFGKREQKLLLENLAKIKNFLNS